jgi:hypothetical protein
VTGIKKSDQANCHISIILLLFFKSASEELIFHKQNKKTRITIAWQPFEGSLSLANVISDSLSKKLSADFIVLEEIPLPPNSFYKPRRRYLQAAFWIF